jgi:hypothetical protein
MSTPLQKQKRLQIVLAIIIGMTIPCYGLGFVFVSVNRQISPTVTPRLAHTPTTTWSPRHTETPGPVIPTRYPTFTPTLTGTATPTRTSTLTPTLTPEPTETFTPTISPTITDTPGDTLTPSDTPETPTTVPE